MRTAGRFSTRALNHAAPRLLRVLMLVSLWNAPLPWVNVHGTLAVDSTAARHLSQHFARFHAGADPFEREAAGWHVHFVLPWTISDEGPCPADGRHHDSHELTLSTASPGRLSDSELSVESTAAGLDLGMPLASLDRPCDGPRPGGISGSQTDRFLQVGSVSLRTLICVANC